MVAKREKDKRKSKKGRNRASLKHNIHMADPLQLLREFTITKRPVVLEGDDLVFDDVRLPRNTETSFRSLKGAGAHYTLDACWFMLQHEDTKFPAYIAECSKLRFPKVSLVDKKELISYLTGRIDSSPFISLISPALITTPHTASTTTTFTPLPSSATGPREHVVRSSEGKRSAGDAQLDSFRDSKQPDASSSSSSSAAVAAKKARLEDIELDDQLKESKRLVAHRLEQPKGAKSVSATPASSVTTPAMSIAHASSSSSEALPYVLHPRVGGV